MRRCPKARRRHSVGLLIPIRSAQNLQFAVGMFNQSGADPRPIAIIDFGKSLYILDFGCVHMAADHVVDRAALGLVAQGGLEPAQILHRLVGAAL